MEEPAVRVAWRALWSSRLVVFSSGVLAVLSFGLAPGSAGFDAQRLTSPFGYLGNLLVAPFARWDSVWYLTIAQGGYAIVNNNQVFGEEYPEWRKKTKEFPASRTYRRLHPHRG